MLFLQLKTEIFLKVSTMCRSHLFLKIFWEVYYHFWCCTEKNYAFGSTRCNFLIQRIKCSPFWEKTFPLSSWCEDHTSKDISARKSCVFKCAPSWNDCKMFIITCNVRACPEKNDILGFFKAQNNFFQRHSSFFCVCTVPNNL